LQKRDESLALLRFLVTASGKSNGKQQQRGDRRPTAIDHCHNPPEQAGR
jgi:hypothetical protein